MDYRQETVDAQTKNERIPSRSRSIISLSYNSTILYRKIFLFFIKTFNTFMVNNYMTTIKLKLEHKIDILKEQRSFSSIVHLSFNRCQDGFKEKEIRTFLKDKFNG